MIVIRNNGKEIIGTNYFDTDDAKRGLAFLSMNGGGIRLLLPDKVPEYILGTDSSAEYADDLVDGMKTANHVVLSRGSSKSFQKQDMLEILFEDHSNTPYCFYMTVEQCHALPRNQDIGYELDFSVWTRDGKQLSKPCYYRTVNDIPCMKPFPVHKRKHRR